jgi:hypothetical protein
MPKRYRKMKGGFLDSVGDTLSSWGNSISEGTTTAWNKTKSASNDAYNYVTGTSSTSYTGGRRTRRHQRGGYMNNTNLPLNPAHFKHMKGGYAANSNIGLTAAPIQNIKTTQVEWLGGGHAQPPLLALGGNSFASQPNFTGGRTKRRRRSKSRKSRKH